MAVFERTWARSGHWAMVATAPDALPITPDAQSLVAAAAALERVDAAAAGRAFAALTQRYPDLYAAWLGLGNTRHVSGDLAGAQQAYASATRIEPRAADAWNNLALTQLALGRLDDAFRSAQHAAALGGPRADRYRATLDAIERARGS